MSLLSILNQVKTYRAEWNKEVEIIIKDSSEKDKEIIKTKNLDRPSLSIAGLGIILFSDLFNYKINKKSAFITSTLVFLMGNIDDIIDAPEFKKSEKKAYLDSSDDFLRTGKGFEIFIPFRNYFIDNFPKKHLHNLFDVLSQYKEEVINETRAESIKDLKNSRIKIGQFNGDFYSEVISAFLDKSITPDERKILRLYSIACTLLDDISDYYEDKKEEKQTFFSLTIKDRNKSLFTLISDELSDINKYFNVSKKLIDPSKMQDYCDLITLTKTGYVFNFSKKLFSHYLN
jgi:hypothetical protein